MRPHFSNNKGIALILVISILAVMVSLVVAFLVAARLESMKAINFKESMKAVSIADAGIEHVKSLLREDKQQNNGNDHYLESWKTAFLGDDVDNDGDGTKEAKWIELIDATGNMYGRYAVSVFDEASKVNINSAGFHNENPLKITEGWSTFEVSLNKLFEQLGVSKPTQLRDDILSYRYGGNVPGDGTVDDNNNNVVLSNDGTDNDGDGDIDEAGEGLDEPMEFSPTDPYGDDNPFLTIRDLKQFPLGKSEFDKVERYVTAYSNDKNLSSDGRIRLDLNEASALDIYQIFEEQEIAEAEQVAANILDYRDTDHRQSVVVSKNGTFYGVEGIRINEIMVRPIYTFTATDHTNSSGPGGAWNISGNHFENSTPDIGGLGGIWWFEDIRPGYYYLKVFGTGAGQTVGDVKVGVKTHVSMKHGDVFVNPVQVGSDGRLKISILNAEIEQPGFTTYFYKFELSEQPDCEFVELINITNQAIDLSYWSIEGLRNLDLVGTIPDGTLIGSYGYLVLAVDRDDEHADVPVNLSNNDISFAGTWDQPEVDLNKVVQLLFSGSVSRTDDVINDSPSVQNITLLLKDAYGNVVDRVKYRATQALYYRASERDDPHASSWSEGSHIFDQWNLSDGLDNFLPLGTPTADNNNLNILGHTFGGVNSDVGIKNNSFSSIGELVEVAHTGSWQRVIGERLWKTVDYFCVGAIRLEAEGHVEPGSEGSWQEVARPAPLTNWYVSETTEDEGIWKFDSEDRLQNGIYRLNVYGNYNDALQIAIRKADETWTEFSPPLIPDDKNVIRYGIVEIGGSSVNATADRSLEIKIKNAVEVEIETEPAEAAFDYITLAAVNQVFGRINLNTASFAVLQTLPGVTAEIAGRIFNSEYKPFGEEYGLGDIFYEDTISEDDEEMKKVFRQIGNLVTVQSDLFEILVIGEAFGKNNKRTAAKKVRIIVER